MDFVTDKVERLGKSLPMSFSGSPQRNQFDELHIFPALESDFK